MRSSFRERFFHNINIFKNIINFSCISYSFFPKKVLFKVNCYLRLLIFDMVILLLAHSLRKGEPSWIYIFAKQIESATYEFLGFVESFYPLRSLFPSSLEEVKFLHASLIVLSPSSRKLSPSILGAMCSCFSGT